MSPFIVRLLALGGMALSATSAFAQNPHAGHGAPAAPRAQAQPSGPGADADRMMGMMRQMMPMMERMRSAAPAERDRMMEQMRPMMSEMMPMMQTMMGAMPGHGQPQNQASASPAQRAFEEVNAKMHRDMMITFTGDADADFVRGMIPHHQGAIDMAEVVLRFGKDEWVRKLANDVIREQRREIAEMQDWLRGTRR